MHRYMVEGSLTDLWRFVAPTSSSESRTKLSKSFLSRGGTREDLGRLVGQARAMNPEERAALGLMVSQGFQPEQVLLFVQADERERLALSKSWLKTPAHEKLARFEGAASTVSTLQLGGTAISSLAVLALGLAMQDPNVVETAAWTTQLAKLVSDNSFDEIGTAATAMGAAGVTVSFAGLLMKGFPLVAREWSREPTGECLDKTQRDLEDRVMGVFSRAKGVAFEVPGAAVSQDLALRELAAIPRTHLPLLDHFHPKELVVFLSSEDDVRSDMMLRHPPSAEARILTVRAMSSTRVGEFVGSLRQTVSTWEGGVADKGAITRDRSMAVLRQARLERRLAGAIPIARPRFGPKSAG